MKKLIYILFLSSLFFASCEKQVIKPVSKSNQSGSDYNVVISEAVNDTDNTHYESSSAEEKTGIIDPNGRDDVGGKSPKKTK